MHPYEGMDFHIDPIGMTYTLMYFMQLIYMIYVVNSYLWFGYKIHDDQVLMSTLFYFVDVGPQRQILEQPPPLAIAEVEA